ncbi:phage holin family protein [Pediococcus pentosaceus]|uniref:phage holin family protein n=1 Tax=Pediococcus pentosaceus TaxID=1255 RepID=UPI00191AF256|nr:phage holin family protein [Pediococcus pentosaceus]MCH4016738.1 phage holin family protein [Pediococcus pentosaceus]MCH4059098.1 phage holin family protein [Pediococcus pentosaceus]MCI1396764.1 phage holin family protein [Pediococcus pentosaceus]MCQ0028132.1 phage holin family protein [Pediococcus pentosaceus]MCT3024996.1 holin [Pediococcus pentosaceus]
MPFHVSLLQSYMAIVDDKLMIAFLFAVILDIGTGMAKGIINQRTGKLNSTKGLFGLIKHSTVIFLILLIYPFMNAIGFQPTADALLIFYIATYAISVVENLGQMEVPFPDFIKKYFVKLQDDYNKGGHNEKIK